jgi:hypothetical protein
MMHSLRALPSPLVNLLSAVQPWGAHTTKSNELPIGNELPRYKDIGHPNQQLHSRNEALPLKTPPY